MKDLIDTTEMYLRTIYELEEEGIPPLRARIAERLDQSGPTVSQTVSRMERDGLLVIAANRELLLTEKGRRIAVSVMRKHRLAERLLTDIIGMDKADIHEEACRWEHVMSDTVERHIIKLLDHPHLSPYGNPIPGLEYISDDHSATPRYPHLVDLDFSDEEPVLVILRRIGELVQTDTELMKVLDRHGIIPGARILVREVDDSIELCSLGSAWVTLPDNVVHAFFAETVERS